MKDRASDIAKFSNDENQGGLASMVYTLFEENTGLREIVTSKANQWLKNPKEGQSMQDLKILGQLDNTPNHYFLWTKVLNIYYV